MRRLKINGIYRHFKGNYYYVLDIAYDSETKERMVVYKPLYKRIDKKDMQMGYRNYFAIIEKEEADKVLNLSHEEQMKLTAEQVR